MGFRITVMMTSLIAHRGASHEAPENTLASFRLGFEEGADFLEADLHLTRDGEIVLIHDDDTQRTTGQPGLVREQTLTDLERLDAGSWKGPRWAGERIPTLAAGLAVVPPGKGAFLEIKCGPEILPRMRAITDASRLDPGKVIVMSFDLSVAIEARKHFEGHPIFWLVEFSQPHSGAPGHPPSLVEELVRTVRNAGLDGLDVEACEAVDEPFVETVHAAGLKLHVWTVNDAVQGRRLRDAGVDGITTDRPRWLREQLR